MTQSCLSFTLTPDQQRVWAALEWRKGRELAETQHGLALRCHLRPRAVREAIRGLREQHGYLIGSGQQGYFVVETAEEKAEALGELYSRIGSLARLAAKMERSSLEWVFGQVRMRLEDQHDL